MHLATRTKVVETYSLTWFWAGACCWLPPFGPSFLGGVLVGADILEFDEGVVFLVVFLLLVVEVVRGESK